MTTAGELRPYLIASMDKLAYQLLGVLAEESLCLQSDIVEANIGWATAVKGVILFCSGAVIVGVSVEVVVDGVVVHHFRNRHVEKEIGVLCPA